jgi:hypothetical protein
MQGDVHGVRSNFNNKNPSKQFVFIINFQVAKWIHALHQ